MNYRPTVAEINLTALRHNLGEIQKHISPQSAVMAIVKANAYGHGAIKVSRTLKECGVKAFGVATIEEGIELRKKEIQGDIFVLGGLLEAPIEEYLNYELKPVIHQLEDLKYLGKYLNTKSRKCSIHLKVDTGMGRLGFLPSQTDELFFLLKKYPHIHIEGVMSHLARADEEDPEPTKQQCLLFEKLKKIYENKGVAPSYYHIANSAAIIDQNFDGHLLARPGLMLYGAYPHPRHHKKIDLCPVMTLKTKIMGLKKYPVGSALSYGGTFVTKRKSLIGILPIGYADGYSRLISNRGSVLVRGIRAPVVGRVCMDLTLIDVTEIPNIKYGEEVILIGSQGENKISVEEVSQWAETIPNEFFCGISNRVLRVYK